MDEQTHYATYLRQKIKGLVDQTTLTRTDVWELDDAIFLAEDPARPELTEIVGRDLLIAALERVYAWRDNHPWEEQS